ncbi:hypothetical protein SAMN05720468_11580 [Fibrobacter sp. UWEL]|nr:hypothetical protein SAMN05720468_11580 [Fibrobacter sp. UWEL]
MRLMARLRKEKSQSKLSFLSDISREYIRCLERGTKMSSAQNLVNLIAASGLDIKKTLCDYADMLEEENEKFKGIAGKEYIRKLKKKDTSEPGGTRHKENQGGSKKTKESPKK